MFSAYQQVVDSIISSRSTDPVYEVYRDIYIVNDVEYYRRRIFDIIDVLNHLQGGISTFKRLNNGCSDFKAVIIDIPLHDETYMKFFTICLWPNHQQYSLCDWQLFGEFHPNVQMDDKPKEYELIHMNEIEGLQRRTNCMRINTSQSLWSF